MVHDSDSSDETVTATVELAVAGRRLRVEMNVPTARVATRRLLPLFQSVANRLIDIACETTASAGETVSCTKGCGACCRQLVPISVTEAHHIRELVETLPEPRRSVLRARFAQARTRLQQASLLEKLLDPQRVTDAESQPLGLSYFELGIACPFLEDESCSIHPDRPVACREYLVTSSPEHCAHPTADTIRAVKVPAKVSRVIRELERPAGVKAMLWVPLILAPEWSDAHPDRTTPRPGTEIVREFFSKLTKRDLPEGS
jgi:Fe-S-cluster containining protein